MALALVALWPLAANHCKLEASTGLTFLQCAVDSHGQDDCADDACATVESGSYRAEDNQAPLATVVMLAAFRPEELPLFTPPPADGVSFRVTAAPPEFPASRQFLFRTAAPPRAPSFAS